MSQLKGERAHGPGNDPAPGGKAAGKAGGKQAGQRPERSLNPVLAAAYDALEAMRVDYGPRRKIVAEEGPEFAHTLAWYGRWKEPQGDADGKPIENMGAFLYGTWKLKDAERRAAGRSHHVWDETFLDWMAKQKRIEGEAAGIHAAAVAARPAEERTAIPADWLPGVPEEEARHLLNRAVRYVKRVRSGRTPLPTDLEVRDTARDFWRRDHEGEMPPWEGE